MQKHTRNIDTVYTGTHGDTQTRVHALVRNAVQCKGCTQTAILNVQHLTPDEQVAF
eukprot:m.1659785 g.1659785  ORF g.1659785 m.1659785 type:complete len:56 (-) comp119886_c0_seq1:49-216(-)